MHDSAVIGDIDGQQAQNPSDGSQRQNRYQPDTGSQILQFGRERLFRRSLRDYDLHASCVKLLSQCRKMLNRPTLVRP